MLFGTQVMTNIPVFVTFCVYTMSGHIYNRTNEYIDKYGQSLANAVK